MTPPERLTVRGPEDILGFIPHSLGYWPAQSLVAMTLQGKSLGATLRLDLPGREVLASPAQFLLAVRRYLEADKEADGTLLAFFTSNGNASSPSRYDGLLAGLVVVLAVGGPGSMIGFDFARTFNPAHRIGTATGIVNVGGFIAALVAIFLIGLVLDILFASGFSQGVLYGLDPFRIALSVQFLLLGFGAAAMLVCRIVVGQTFWSAE